MHGYTIGAGTPVPGRTYTVSSLFRNAELVLQVIAPRSAQAVLGPRWSFGLPRDALVPLTEYSLPYNHTPFREALAARSGLHIAVNTGDGSDLESHLAGGRPAIVAVDSYHLPYRPAYGRVHSNRTLIVWRRLSGGDVYVQDIWMPSYAGPLSRADLTRARYADVPLDGALEPIFAGCKLNGEWFAVELAPLDIRDTRSWAAEMLRTLYDEATTSAANDLGDYGLNALIALCERLAALLVDEMTWESGTAARRVASLLLRAELSSRVYLCAFLSLAARLMDDTFLSSEIEIYRCGLRYLEAARDVLIKTLAFYRPEYGRYILSCLQRAIEGEQRLVTMLATRLDGER